VDPSQVGLLTRTFEEDVAAAFLLSRAENDHNGEARQGRDRDEFAHHLHLGPPTDLDLLSRLLSTLYQTTPEFSGFE
jgi:hypothetical protein